MATIDNFTYPPNCPSCGPLQVPVALPSFNWTPVWITIAIIAAVLFVLWVDRKLNPYRLTGPTGIADDPGDF